MTRPRIGVMDAGRRRGPRDGSRDATMERVHALAEGPRDGAHVGMAVWAETGVMGPSGA